MHKHPGCIVAMEACATAHHWARTLSAHGHVVRLIAPKFVKPYVKSQKNDMADAEAIAEAGSRPTMCYPAGDACIAERAFRRSKDSGAARSRHDFQVAGSAHRATNAGDQCVARTSIDMGVIKMIMTHAAAVHGLKISPEPVDLARIARKRLGLIGRAVERGRRPTAAELNRLSSTSPKNGPRSRANQKQFRNASDQTCMATAFGGCLPEFRDQTMNIYLTRPPARYCFA